MTISEEQLEEWEKFPDLVCKDEVKALIAEVRRLNTALLLEEEKVWTLRNLVQELRARKGLE